MRNRSSALVIIAIVIAGAVSCRRAATENNTTAADAKPAAAAWSVTVQPTTSPAGANSSLPQIAASDKGVLLSWLATSGKTNNLRFAERTVSGWSAPLTAASGSEWFLSYADPPSVTRLSDGTLVAQWEKTTDPRIEAMDLMLASSTDNGKTWSRPFTPHRDKTKSQHAFASLFEMPGRSLGVVWLDGRESAEGDDPAMIMRYAAFDSAWKETAEAQIDSRVCECCSTATVLTDDGALTAFRDRGKGEIRNIAVSRLENGKWTEPAIVHDDKWETFSCPVNGPALAARGRHVVVAWFTVQNEQGHAYAAFSEDAGRTWGAPIQLDDAASTGRVDVELLDDGSAVASWVEIADNRGRFQIRRVEPGGAKSAAVSVAGVGGSSSSGFPRMARQGNELVFAWTETGTPDANGDVPMKVQTATASLPAR
jgi:hypothetical protein